MSFRFEVKVPEDVTAKWTAGLKEAGTAWLDAFGRLMIKRTLDTFDALAHGGTYRGVTWPPYRHKPPAGRGGWNARLLDDTGTLRSSIGEIFELAGERLVVGTAVPYAARQQRTRPFLFFESPADALTAADIAAAFIRKALAANP